MYPYIQLRWFSISMTWLWIISFLVVFLFIAKKRSARYGVQFRTLLRHIPIIIMLAYLLWTWSRYLRSDFIVISFDPRQWLLYLSPYEYRFHFSGMILWIAIGWYKFLKTQRREHHIHRRSILFESICLASLPLWICLLLGDHFIWRPVDTWRYLSAIDPLSKMAVYDKVVPIGIYLSVWSWIIYILIALLHKRKPKIHRAFPWLMLYRLMIGSILIRQIYPRHFVAKAFGQTVDIKQYICLFLILLIARQRRLIQTSSSMQQPHNETDLLSTR